MCFCACVHAHQAVSPAQRRTGGPVDSMHMRCYYSIGDSAGLVSAKLIQLHACTEAPHELMHATNLYFAVLHCVNAQSSLGGFMLCADPESYCASNRLLSVVATQHDVISVELQ